MSLSSSDLEAWVAYFKLLEEIVETQGLTDEVYNGQKSDGCGGL